MKNNELLNIYNKISIESIEDSLEKYLIMESEFSLSCEKKQQLRDAIVQMAILYSASESNKENHFNELEKLILSESRTDNSDVVKLKNFYLNNLNSLTENIISKDRINNFKTQYNKQLLLKNKMNALINKYVEEE